MDIDQIIERIGSDNAPTVEELTAARTELQAARDELVTQIKAGGTDLAALTSAKGEYDAVTEALGKVGDTLSELQAQINAIIAEVEPVSEEASAEVAEEVIEPVAASVTASIRSAMSRVSVREPAPVAEANLSDVDVSMTLGGRKIEGASFADIGQAFADNARTFGGSKTSVFSLKADLHSDRRLDGDAAANQRKLLDLFGGLGDKPVTASGGCCSLPEPIFDQPMLGDTSRPIRGSMDVLQASRGAVSTFPAVCIPDAGADVWTCAQDAAVTSDPATWKACVEVECDDASTTLVEPVFKCLTIGTFQQRFAPEQWEAHLFETGKLAIRKAEARLFAQLVAASTSTHTGFATGSTYANAVKSLYRAAALIRQDQRLGDLEMAVYGPSWLYTAIVEDSVTRRLNVADEIEITKTKFDAVLADAGITFIGSDDVADLESFQYDGALAAYPATAPLVMVPVGAAKVLDGGERNMGIDVTDHDLNRQNKIGAFDEFWEGLLVRSCNIKAINLPIEDCDTIACP